MKIGSGFTPDDNSRPEKRRTSDLVRVFEQNDSIINRLYLSDHNFQAVYNVCAVHVVLLAISKVLFDSLAAGRLFVDLHLVHFAFGYFNLAGIATFILIELLLLSMAVSVHPALMVWKLVRTKFPSFKVDLAFLLVYVLGIASSVVLVLWVGFEVRLGFALSITITTEQVRLIMKTYSYVRETAKKVLTPWNKDDTSGPAVVYAGQMEPKVGSLANYLYFLFAPTLLYRDRYPRNDGPINWKNVIVYLSQFVAIFLTIMVIYQDLAMPPSLSLADVLKSLVYSLVAGFAHIAIFNVGVIHSWMNLHAELLRFADRQFNSDWWTAVSYPVYYRKCNAVIYDWIHAYMYTDVKNVLSAYGFGSAVPACFCILVSALMHEYIFAVGLGFCLPFMSVLFGGLGALFYIITQFFGLSAVRRGSNTIILLATGIGMGLLAFFYILEFGSRQYYCPRENQFSDFFFSSRFLQCYREFN
eukprot:Em0184g4a